MHVRLVSVAEHEERGLDPGVQHTLKWEQIAKLALVFSRARPDVDVSQGNGLKRGSGGVRTDA